MISASHETLAKILANPERTANDPRAELLVLKAADFAARDMHGASDVQVFATIAAGLVPDVGEAAAMTVAELVAGRSDCPDAIVRALARRGDGASLIALRTAPRLDADSIAIALMAGDAEALALAGRPDLDPEAVAILLARDNAETSRALAGNVAAPLDSHQIDLLLRRARSDAGVARALLRQGSRLGPRRASLFMVATPPDRRGMIAEIDRIARLDPHLAPRRNDAAEAALRLCLHDAPTLGRWLSTWLPAEPPLATAIATDRYVEPLAVALRALGIEEGIAERCLVFAGAASALSGKETLEVARLFRRLDSRTARRLMALVAGMALPVSVSDQATTMEPALAGRTARAAAAPRLTEERRPARSGTAGA